jgi:hypothetical protein
MTTTDRPVKRATTGQYAVLYRKARPIVVAIERQDILVFREKGRRSRWTLPIDTAFKYAVRLQAFYDAAERKRNRRKK